MRKYLAITAIIFFASSFALNAQSISVQSIPSDSIESRIEQFFESTYPGLDLLNVSFTGDTNSIGTFHPASSGLLLNQGIIITSGHYMNAPGPNNSQSTSYNSTGGSDPQLAAMVPFSINDAAVIEFDFVDCTNLSFSTHYIFASEEYMERVNGTTQDVFGIFISGPTLGGGPEYINDNLAYLPYPYVPVGIENVNPNTNSFYYIENGDTSSINTPVEYDGYTKVLLANASIVPCETYHVKIAIGDGGADDYDSALFLAAATTIPTSDIYCTVQNVNCNGSSTGSIVVDSVLTTSPLQYQWSNGANTMNLTNLPAGTYTVTITNQAMSQTVITYDVLEPDSLSITLSSTPIDTLISPYGSVDATVTGGTPPYSFSWSNGAITEDLFEATYGTHELVTTDANGCSATAEAFVDYVINNQSAELSSNASLEIYPNPASEIISIELKNELIKSIACFNISGTQQISMLNVSSNSVPLEIKHLPNGTYLLKVNDKYMKRFVKM